MSRYGMVVFYIIRNLFRMLIAALLLPIILFTRRFSSIIVMVILAVLLWQCVMDKPSAPQKPLGPDGKPIVYIDPVRTEEDGNSSFSTDLIKKMREDERVVYSQHFYWALNQGATGQKYTWNQHNIAGEITIAEVFTNKTGSTCKRFNEVLKVHEIRQTSSGLACARGDGSWCKLHRSATPACGLGREAGFFDGISSKINRMF